MDVEFFNEVKDRVKYARLGHVSMILIMFCS